MRHDTVERHIVVFEALVVTDHIFEPLATERDLLNAGVFGVGLRAKDHELMVLALRVRGHECRIWGLVGDVQSHDLRKEIAHPFEVLGVDSDVPEFFDSHVRGSFRLCWLKCSLYIRPGCLRYRGWARRVRES